MSRLLTLFCLFICVTFNVVAQGTWTFAAPTNGTGSTGPENARAICVDASGNTYITGNFNDANDNVATDFDLNASTTNTYTATSVDGFIASYDKNGNFRWKTIVSGTGSDFGAPSGGICTNGTHVWVSGTANVSVGSPSIISSTNTVAITSPGTGVDAFISKLNCSNGAVQWAQAFGGTGANDFGEGICLDPSNNCYMIGSYSSAFTLGSITAPAPGGVSDFFIAKFSPGGTMTRFNSGGSTANADMIANGGGICYVPGSSPTLVVTGQTGASSANFGSFTGLGTFGLNDALLLELDTTLNFTNALVMGSAAADELMGITYDPVSSGIFVAGFCSGNITFPGTPALTGLGMQDIVFARYNIASNNFVWSSILGGTNNDRGWSVAADGYGGIILSGNTSSTPCNFGGSISIPTNAGLSDLYVTRFNASGVPAWVLSAFGPGADDARSICSYVETTPSFTQSIFVTGITTNGAATFGSTIVGNDGGSDFYLAKLNDANVAPPLSATQSQVNILCHGMCTGSATVVASGGVAPYTYSWSPSGGTMATASALCVGTYTCTITDAAFSTISKVFNITEPSALSLSTAVTNVSCNGGSNGAINLTPTGGTGAYTYFWSSGQTTQDLSGRTAGTYIVTVTDANSCTATSSATITQPSAINLTTSITHVTCNGGSNGAIDLTSSGGTGAYTYFWSNGQTIQDLTGRVAGTYVVTVTDANGCTATTSATITQPSAINLTTSITNVSCNGGSNGAINLTPAGGTGAYTYIWSSGQTTQDLTGRTAGSYGVTVTDANGCTATTSATITLPAVLGLTTSVTNVACNGGSNGAINLTVTGGTSGYTYIWSQGSQNEDLSGLSSGTFTVTVTDANGCTASTSAMIIEPALLGLSTSVTNVSCNGGSNGLIDLTVTGGTTSYTYQWSNGQTIQDLSGRTAGTYVVTVTDANGCTATTSATITQPAPMNLSTSITNVTCNGDNNGAIDLEVSNGIPGYTYLWSSGQTSQDLSARSAGIYVVTVTDANGCTATTSATITQPSAINLSTSITNVSCNGGSNGAINLIPSGGTGVYTYLWSSGQTTEDIFGLVEGMYTVTVTDANGCTQSTTVSVSQPLPITTTLVTIDVTCNGGNNGAVDLEVSNGTPGYTYLWSNGQTTQDIVGLSAGTYAITITDANGCIALQNVMISEPPAGMFTFIGPGTTFNDVNNWLGGCVPPTGTTGTIIIINVGQTLKLFGNLTADIINNGSLKGKFMLTGDITNNGKLSPGN